MYNFKLNKHYDVWVHNSDKKKYSYSCVKTRKSQFFNGKYF